ncbi:Phosphoglycerate kinase [Diplonema papillatum]|uniref:Phosphoglycerate kinase n=1 Tax=Diplonema papillatum TaxID=91374 RepID=A0A0B6VM25_9EUGL|nr:Phosphoglycerate kinase [Diplonema papillatum]KAJ9450157.1 Phosphoglycerate kinase [Diplonema papillatum]BAQ25443.1 phosphoglycerate kinase [Diplonema papillatum]|eukprot:gene428-623_t
MGFLDNFGKLSIDDVPLKGKKVLMRVDFNVPIGKDGQVKNDLRIRGAMPSIQKVLSEGGSLILMSHLGRPKGVGYEAKYSMRPVQTKLQELLGSVEVLFADDCMNASEAASALRPGQVLLLENLRFYKAESSKKRDDRMKMAQKLASYGNVFISDAFGTAHRDAASMTGIPKVLGKGAAGYLMKKELDYFASALAKPARPYVSISGGAKVSDKILLLDSLIEKSDCLIIGGAMAYTFLKAQGYTIGKSKCETSAKSKDGVIDTVALARKIIDNAKDKGVKLLLPVDHRCAAEFKDVPAIVTKDANIPDNLMALDVGPKTEALFAKEISQCKTCIWNGPVGVFEMKNFRSGTWAVVKAMADNKSALTIVGGGDSAAAADMSGFGKQLSHISTGGGASLELIEGKTLPGLAALTSKDAPMSKL